MVFVTRFHDYFIFFILYVLAFGVGSLSYQWVITIAANVWVKAKMTKQAGAELGQAQLKLEVELYWQLMDSYGVARLQCVE